MRRVEVQRRVPGRGVRPRFHRRSPHGTRPTSQGRSPRPVRAAPPLRESRLAGQCRPEVPAADCRPTQRPSICPWGRERLRGMFAARSICRFVRWRESTHAPGLVVTSGRCWLAEFCCVARSGSRSRDHCSCAHDLGFLRQLDRKCLLLSRRLLPLSLRRNVLSPSVLSIRPLALLLSQRCTTTLSMALAQEIAALGF